MLDSERTSQSTGARSSTYMILVSSYRTDWSFGMCNIYFCPSQTKYTYVFNKRDIPGFILFTPYSLPTYIHPLEDIYCKATDYNIQMLPWISKCIIGKTKDRPHKEEEDENYIHEVYDSEEILNRVMPMIEKQCVNDERRGPKGGETRIKGRKRKLKQTQ